MLLYIQHTERSRGILLTSRQLLMNTSVSELTAILQAHAARYPLMQPTDAVKLIYQNEFGGGHMIDNEEACLAYLRREYAHVEKSAAALLIEDIGNGIVRVHLGAIAPEALDALGAAFIRSANAHKGSTEVFLQKLEVLRRVTAEGLFSFGSSELEAYLADYARAGYPPVSHSETFRAAYHPAYRVVRTEDLPAVLNR